MHNFNEWVMLLHNTSFLFVADEPDNFPVGMSLGENM